MPQAKNDNSKNRAFSEIDFYDRMALCLSGTLGIVHGAMDSALNLGGEDINSALYIAYEKLETAKGLLREWHELSSLPRAKAEAEARVEAGRRMMSEPLDGATIRKLQALIDKAPKLRSSSKRRR